MLSLLIKKPNFKVGDHIRISKCQTIFAKPNWSEEIFIIKNS